MFVVDDEMCVLWHIEMATTSPSFLILCILTPNCFLSLCVMQSGDYAYSIACCEVNTPTTEDCYSVLTSGDLSLFAVFDGHGGSFASQYAALHLPGIIMTQLTDLVKLSDNSVTSTTPTSSPSGSHSSAKANEKNFSSSVGAIAECLHQSFCQCDEEILTIAMTQHTLASSGASSPPTGSSKGPRFASVGSCVSLLILVKGVMFTAHCG